MSKEDDIFQNITGVRILIQYSILLLIMIAIHLTLDNSYGSIKESFFGFNTSSKFFDSSQLMWTYTILIYLFIISIREWTRRMNYKGLTKEQKTEKFRDFVLYSLICLGTFVFASAYIRKKFSSSMSGGGYIQDKVSSILNTKFETFALYSGILTIGINSLTSLYQYIKYKDTNEKDKMLRAVYYGQIVSIIIFIISSIFIIGFGWSEKNATSVIKLIIAYIIFGTGLFVVLRVKSKWRQLKLQ